MDLSVKRIEEIIASNFNKEKEEELGQILATIVGGCIKDIMEETGLSPNQVISNGWLVASNTIRSQLDYLYMITDMKKAFEMIKQFHQQKKETEEGQNANTD